MQPSFPFGVIFSETFNHKTCLLWNNANLICKEYTGQIAQVVPAEKRGRVYMMHLNRAACAEAGRAFGFSCAAP